MSPLFDDTDFEPAHKVSATGSLLDDMALFGGCAIDDPVDQRPPPADQALDHLVAAMFATLAKPLRDSGLEIELEPLVWGLANLFHAAVRRIDRRLDDNERAQKASQRRQDGSEIRSVELEQLLAAGRSLLERRDALDHLRQRAISAYAEHVGAPWRARGGSFGGTGRALTAAVIDSRDFLIARRRAETDRLLPPGVKIAFTGGVDCNDVAAIWAALDRVHAKHPDMVLLHGGAPRGAERIAACWADARRIAQVVFKPDWTQHRNAAPFKRNDQLLETLPIGLVVFPGGGVSDNLADKARKLGIPLFDFRRRRVDEPSAGRGSGRT